MRGSAPHSKIRIQLWLVAWTGVALGAACGPQPTARAAPRAESGTAPAADPADGATAGAAPSPGPVRAAPGGLRVWRHRARWTAASFTGNRAYEDAIVKHVNALRRQLGLHPLVADARLRVGARQHTTEMIRKGYYNHTSPVAAWRAPHQRACYAGYLEPFVSENIGMISGYPDVARAMFESWKKSPGHYRNMVDPRVNRIGVGLASTQRNGMTLWIGTQLFGADPLDLRSLVVREEKKDVVRLTVTLKTTGGLQIKAWLGRQYAGDVPGSAAGRHVFTVDVPRPLRRARRYGFAVKVGHQTPLVCAQAQLSAAGTVTSSRVTYHPLCRRILDIRARAKVLRVRQRVHHGEARAKTAALARGVRFFLNRTWGPSLPLRAGRWVPFSQALPSSSTVGFSLVLGQQQKDYLTLDFSRRDPFVCP